MTDRQRLACCAAHLPAYLLGKDGAAWKLAVDVDADTLQEFLADDYPEAQDLRALMPDLPVAELAIAGHATALSQWHKVPSLNHPQPHVPPPFSSSSGRHAAWQGCLADREQHPTLTGVCRTLRSRAA